MSEQIIVKFDYNTAMLNKVAKDAQAIDTTDMAQVEQTKKELVTLRGKIQVQGKGFREQAIAYNKEVLKQEKEFLGIIEPIEIEYKEILKKDEENKVIEARKELLPMKLQQLKMLEHTHEVSDDTILEMSDEAWVAYHQSEMQYNTETIANIAQQAQQKADQKARELQIRAEMEEKAKQDKVLAEKQAQEAQERAVQAEKLKAEQSLNQEKERAEKVKQEEIKQAQDLADKEIADKARLDANKKYQDFLLNNSYNESTDIIQKNGSEVKVYRLVATYKNN